MLNKNYTEHMSYDALKNMRLYNPAWKLLAASRGSLAISFLYSEFVADNRREIAEHTLAQDLSDFIEQFANAEEELPPSRELLARWSDDEHSWLRKFYPKNSDETHYDLTSMAQKAIEWIVSLKAQSFIGTESRLLMVFQLLNEIVEQSDDDPERRVKELQRRRDELEAEIARIEQGVVSVLEPVQIKERFSQAMQMSREILSDFRGVEQNFRDLNRSMIKKIAGWDKGKGELLEDFFYTHNGIYQSDQGKSFEAFFQFIMSPQALEDFELAVNKICQLEPIQEMNFSVSSSQIVDDWITGGTHVQDTLAVLAEQLRRYVDEDFMEQERKINKMIKSIESSAIAISSNEKPQGVFVHINAISPEINLPFDRPLFSPPIHAKFSEITPQRGGSEDDDSALYSHVSVDKKLLKNQILTVLEKQQEISLAQILKTYPIKMGLAELITYLVIAQSGDFNVVIQDDINEKIAWEDHGGNTHFANLGRIVYSKKENTEDGNDGRK